MRMDLSSWAISPENCLVVLGLLDLPDCYFHLTFLSFPLIIS